MASFVISKRKNDDYQFTLKADNGQILITSEGYVSKSSCLNGIESAKLNSIEYQKFELKQSMTGKYYFFLKASNGQVIAASEMYSSEHVAKMGITAVMEQARKATIYDIC